MGKLILVIGGCRSGKSSFSQGLCETMTASGGKAYIAASPVTDPEMAERITRHQRDRQGRNWRTLEETIDLSGALRSCWHVEVVLIDCLTLWVSNLLLAEGRPGQMTEDAAAQLAGSLAAHSREHPGTVVVVTNEVGAGIVPENALARRYRDLLGRVNQEMAAAADRVVWLVAGIPVTIKGQYP